MREDTISVVERCAQCRAFNDKGKDKGMFPLMIGESFERIGIDLMGPFPITENGNKFIVVAIDYLTKYVEIDVLKEKSAINVADFIYKRIILVHIQLQYNFVPIQF